jgi:hypothetical protein
MDSERTKPFKNCLVDLASLLTQLIGCAGNK